MKRTYWQQQRPDGGTDITSEGPGSRFWRGFRWGAGAFFLASAAVAGISGAWQAFGILLLVGALFIPPRRRR